MENLKEIVKATLFVAGEGIEIEYLAEKLGVKEKDIRKSIDQLKEENKENSGIQIVEYKNKVQFASNPKYVDQISSVLNPIREKALTRAALETVAIIAYKQPITRLEIEQIRGGASADYALSILEENKMVEVVGRKDAVGKPLLYGTTDEFLKRFNLTDINNLPDYEQLMERIALIREQDKPKNENDSLYYEYKLGETRDGDGKVIDNEEENLFQNQSTIKTTKNTKNNELPNIETKVVD